MPGLPLQGFGRIERGEGGCVQRGALNLNINMQLHIVPHRLAHKHTRELRRIQRPCTFKLFGGTHLHRTDLGGFKLSEIYEVAPLLQPSHRS